jgi:TctA family transporter
MKQLDGISAIALILVVSFAIDRIVTALLFLLSFVRLAPDRAADERKYKLMYYCLAGVLGIVVLAYYGQVRVLTALGIQIEPLIDTLLTGIVLVGGADRIAEFLKAPGAAPQKQEAQPIEITGKLYFQGDSWCEWIWQPGGK